MKEGNGAEEGASWVATARIRGERLIAAPALVQEAC